MTEGIDTIMDEDQSGSGDSDSGVMKALRKQIKDLEDQIKSQPSRDSLEAEVRSKLERESAAAQQLVAAGHPAGLAELMLAKIDADAEINEDVTSQFLSGLGYEAKAPSSESEEETTEERRQLADVTQLSRQVSVAATGDVADTISDRIAKANSVSEIAQIAAEGGFAQ